jgi:hypothetical protein
MPQMLRFWGQSRKYPLYEVSQEGEIRKIGTEFDQIVPQFWGRLDGGEGRWLVTIFDEKRDRDVTVPEEDVTAFIDPYEGKYENY